MKKNSKNITSAERSAVKKLLQDNNFVLQLNRIIAKHGRLSTFHIAKFLIQVGVTDSYKKAVKLVGEFSLQNTAQVIEQKKAQELLSDESFLRQAQFLADKKGKTFLLAKILLAYGLAADFRTGVRLVKKYGFFHFAENYEVVEDGFSVLVFQGLTNIFQTGGNAVYDPVTKTVRTDNPLAYAYNNNLDFEVFNLQSGSVELVDKQRAYAYFDNILSYVWKKIKDEIRKGTMSEDDISGLSLLIFFSLVFGFEKGTGKTTLKRVILHTDDMLAIFYDGMRKILPSNFSVGFENDINNFSKTVIL